MIRLAHVDGSRRGRPPDELVEARITLGRGEGALVGFTEPAVSTSHAVIVFRAGWYELLDEHSNNGTFLLGPEGWAEVRGAHRLRRGDRIRLGNPGPEMEVDFVYDAERVYAWRNQNRSRQVSGSLRLVVALGVLILVCLAVVLLLLAYALSRGGA